MSVWLLSLGEPGLLSHHEPLRLHGTRGAGRTRLHELRLRRELPRMKLLARASGRSPVRAERHPHAGLSWELALGWEGRVLSGSEGVALLLRLLGLRV